MVLRRGLQAIKQLKEEQGEGGGDGRKFIIRGGESAIIRFFGNFETEEDPVIGTIHYVKRLPHGQQYNNCSQNTGSDQCVFCYLKENGDKGIGKSNRAFFYVKDTRKTHKLDQEVMVIKPGYSAKPGQMLPAEAYNKTKYPPCSAPARQCMYCAQGNQAAIKGFCYWELAVTYADQLVSQQASIRDYCRCGSRNEDGSGTILVTGYLCGSCQQQVEFYPEQGKPVAYCNHCRQTFPPLESISCSTCEDSAQRCDLQDFRFKVTRVGDDTDTTYNFEAIHPCAPPDEEELAEAAKYKPDWEKVIAADPPQQQAAKLAVPCPFTTPGHGAQAYQPEQQSPVMMAPPVGRRPIPVAQPKPAPQPAQKPMIQQQQRTIIGLHSGNKNVIPLQSGTKIVGPGPSRPILGLKLPKIVKDDIIPY